MEKKFQCETPLCDCKSGSLRETLTELRGGQATGAKGSQSGRLNGKLSILSLGKQSQDADRS